MLAEGPYEATKNDAQITKDILNSNIKELYNYGPGDIIFVDRGFRDCQTELMNMGFVVKMPVCQPSNIQLTTNEANNTRLVTKIRYKVEHLNGMMKNT